MTYVDSYLQSKVIGADGLELITMLYDRALLALNIAKDSILKGLNEPERVTKKAKELGKATDILYYLNDILDKQRGGEIAENLSIIYTTLANELVRANLFNDVEIIEKCINILCNLKSAWEDIKKQEKEVKNEQKRTFAGAI